MDDLREIAKYFNIKLLDDKNNYWLFRVKDIETMDDFYKNKKIALKYIFSLNKVIDKDNKRKVPLGLSKCEKGDKIKSIYYYQNIFINKIKKNDIILLTEPDTRQIIIGKVLKNEYYIDKLKSKNLIETYISRKIEWLKLLDEDKLDIYLHKVLNSDRKITMINKYAHYIDRSIYGFYIKDNIVHMLFQVKRKKNIAAIKLLKFIKDVIKTVDIYNEIYNENLDKNKIELQINIQSPGPIEFFGNIENLLIVGIILLIIVGGKISFQKTKDHSYGELETEGLIEKLIKFYKLVKYNNLDEEKKEWKRSLEESINSLELKKPEIFDEEDKKE